MDWKEMLSSLKDSGELPQSNGNEDNTEFTDVSPDLKKSGETIHIVMEKKGRKGKCATIAEGFTCPDSELEKIASSIKRRLATGGSARGGEILMQGDCRQRLAEELRKLGFNVK